MTELNVFSRSEITGGDTYEIAYAHKGPNLHWSEESLYFSDDSFGMKFLWPYFEQVIPNYNVYGPQKILITQWDRIEQNCRAANQHNASVRQFFEQVKLWLTQGNADADYFWILGI